MPGRFGAGPRPQHRSGPAGRSWPYPAGASCKAVFNPRRNFPQQRPSVRVRLLVRLMQAGRVRLPVQVEQAVQVRRQSIFLASVRSGDILRRSILPAAVRSGPGPADRRKRENSSRRTQPCNLHNAKRIQPCKLNKPKKFAEIA